MKLCVLVLALAVGSQAFFKPGEAPPMDQIASDEDIFADDEVTNFEPKVTTVRDVSDAALAESTPKKCGMRQENVYFRTALDTVQSNFAEFNWAVPIFEVLWNGTENYISVGSLIHPQVVLTVAHYFKQKKNWMIRAGDWDIANTDEFRTHQSIYVSNVVIHPRFRRATLKYDVALLILATPVTPGPNVGFACLPPAASVTPPGTSCVVTGWGVTQYENGTITEIMKMVDVPIVADDDCQEALRARIGQAFDLHRSMLCAGGRAGKDACLKDGGGPLVCPYKTSKDQYYQAGIVSWGHKCGVAGVPGVYTDVAEVRQWIDDQMLAKGYETTTYTA